jgi:hypothetical protein
LPLERAVIETALLVPLADNDGRRFEPALLRQLERRLLRFGGVTGPLQVAGTWQVGGRVYRDTNLQFVVGLTSWTQLPRWLKIVRWALVQFRQEALYIKVAGIPEIVTPSAWPTRARSI